MAKKKPPLKRMTQFISWLVGSWWGVILHAAWFGAWLTFNFSLDLLTLSVSLEAIFIGIFLLMASNESEAAREAKEARARAKDRQTLKQDVSLDEQELVHIKSLRRELKELRTDLAEIKKKL